MAEKILQVLQQYSKDELLEFLQKNGYDEFEDILNNGDITTGEKFLNLTELQIIPWKLPPAVKKKLLSLLEELKQHPQKFFRKSEIDKHTICTRGPSLRTQADFREKLEHVITITKPSDVKLVKKPAARPSETLYDPDGYLIPIDKSPTTEENDDEPPPSVSKRPPLAPPQTTEENDDENPPSDFTSGIRVSKRPPLALPRESSDGDYIKGPEDIDTSTLTYAEPYTFPRVHRNRGNRDVKPQRRKPGAFPAAQLPKTIAEEEIQAKEEEEVTYEPMPHVVEDPPSHPSAEPMNVGFLAGFLSKIYNLFRKNRKPERGKVERIETKAATIKKSDDNREPTEATAESKNQSRMPTRPLPALPAPEANIAASKPQEPKIVIEDMYERVDDDVFDKYVNRLQLHIELSNVLNLRDGLRGEKSNSENNLATAGAFVINGNIDETNKPEYPESTEESKLIKVKNPSGRIQCPSPLPLPPPTLPQIQLDQDMLDNMEQGEDEEEYYYHLD